MINNNVYITLNNAFDNVFAYENNNHVNSNSKSKSKSKSFAQRVLQQITNKLTPNRKDFMDGYDYYSIDSYPYITIKHSEHNFNFLSDYSYIKINHSEVNYNNITILKLAKDINLLIWAFAYHNSNPFGKFLSQWNYVMTLEAQHASVNTISASVNTYKDNNLNDIAYFYTADNYVLYNYNDINTWLRNLAKGIAHVCVNNNVKSILRTIINSKWYEKVSHINMNNDKYIIKYIINNAKSISNNDSNNNTVVDVLKKYNIVLGSKLQNKLVSKISYNNDFKVARGYAIAISKISVPNAMYIYNQNNPWSVKRVSGNDIKAIMKKALNKNNQINKIEKKQQELQNKLEELKNN